MSDKIKAVINYPKRYTCDGCGTSDSTYYNIADQESDERNYVYYCSACYDDRYGKNH